MPDSLQFNFGQLTSHPAAPRRQPDERFCIALLGDFSGRAHRSERRSSDELARLKPLLLDADTFDTIIEKFGTCLHLALGAQRDGGTLEIKPRSLDDLHPDALHDSLPLFAELALLRQRLSQPGTFAAAAAEVRLWAAAPGTAETRAEARAETTAAARQHKDPARNDAVRSDGVLLDFVALFGLPALERAPSPIDALIREVVQPHLQTSFARPAPDAPELMAAVDRALSAAMRQVLHHPDFQGLEAAWRSLDFIMRRVETDSSLQVRVFDVSAEEFAADLAASETLEHSGLYRLLVAQPALNAAQDAPSALVGLYSFAMTAAHAELLGRMGAIAAGAGAPFIAAMGQGGLQRALDAVQAVVDVAEVGAVGAAATQDDTAAKAWQALRRLPVAQHLALATPGFLLRQAYGRRTDEIERFAFEEFEAQQQPPTSLLWGNPAVLAAVLLAQHVHAAGANAAPARQLDIDNLPLCLWADSDGEDVAPSCTEHLLTDSAVARLQSLGLTPVLQHRGRAEVRLGGFMSLTGGPLAGRWTKPV